MNSLHYKETEDTLICRIWDPHNGGNKYFYFLGYNALHSVEIFAYGQLQANLLFRLLLKSEDGDNTFLRNIDWLSVD
jgi:hypothetical protein